MTSFQRPVRAEALFGAPEMALTSDDEVEVDRRGADEGEGIGFDNLDPSAYAERIFTSPAPLESALRWYGEQLVRLGWQETFVDAEVRRFTRDADEFVQVQILPLQETKYWSWSKYYKRSGPFARISFTVKGSWQEPESSKG